MSSYRSLLKMPIEKLAAKCIALEEMLQRYYQFEATHYDLQSKYTILQEKLEKISVINQKQSTLLNDTTSQSSNKKLFSQMKSQIEVFAVEDLESNKTIEELKKQNQLLKQDIVQYQTQIQEISQKYEQLQNEIVKQSLMKTASDSKYNSIDEKNNESITIYKAEISRLNNIVAQLRLKISQQKTKEFDEEWMKSQLIKYQKQSQLSNDFDHSYNVLDIEGL